MMDSRVRGIAETLRLRTAQDALVATPSNSLPSLEVQQCLAFDNPFSTLGLQKALPPMPHDEQSFGLDSFMSSGKVWMPKNKRDTELVITHLMRGVKDGSASCGVVLHKDFNVHSVHFEENQFQELEQRGGGVSGHVTAYKDNSGNKFVRKHMKDGKKLREQEVISMRKLCHPNICKVYALACHAGSVDIMMQDAGRSLYTRLRELRNKLGPETGSQLYYGVVQDLACQGFRALHHMHRRKVYHLDLKPDNILVDLTSHNQLHLMLADFGSSLIGDQMMSFSMQLTPEYWAPELWQRLAPCLRSKDDYNKLQKEQFPPQASFDTYAMGLTVYFMCTLRHLLKVLEAKFVGTSNDTQKSFLFKARLMTEHAHLIAGWATQGPFVYDEPLPLILQELLKNTLQPDPEKRWTDSQAVEWLSGKPVIDEDEEEEESENEELQVPTQVHDTVSGYTGESMVVEEDVWQSAVTSFHDGGDHLFGTASFQSLQDHDVKGQQKLGLLVRNVQPSQDVTFQASKHELVAGAPTNLPTTFRQNVVVPEAKQNMVLEGYYAVQLNNTFALMELDEDSPAADQGVDLDLSLRVNTSQDCIPDVAVPVGFCQAEEKPAWKPTQFGVQQAGDVAFAGDALGMRRNMNVGTQPLPFEGGKGTLETPVHPLAPPDGVNSMLPPIAPLGKGGSARAPSKAVSKKGKTVCSKGHAHPYGIKSASGTGKHTVPLSIGKKMIFYPGVVDKQPSPQSDLPPATFFVAGSAAPTPAARTMQEVPARTLQPITRAEDAVVAVRMPRGSSARYINPWSVEANEQAQPPFPVSAPVQEAFGAAQGFLPEVRSTVMRAVQVQPQAAFELGSLAEESIQQQAGNIPFFGLLL